MFKKSLLPAMITTKLKTRFCFAWCCTDLNRPWPPTAESQVQENHFETFLRKVKIESNNYTTSRARWRRTCWAWRRWTRWWLTFSWRWLLTWKCLYEGSYRAQCHDYMKICDRKWLLWNCLPCLGDGPREWCWGYEPQAECVSGLFHLFVFLVFYCSLYKIISSVIDCILPVLRTWSRSCSPCTSRRTPTPSSAPHRPRQISEHHPISKTISQDNYKDYQLLTIQCVKSSIYAVHYILKRIAFQMINWIQSIYV